LNNKTLDNLPVARQRHALASVFPGTVTC